MTTAFTLLFLAALALTTLLRLWLARRHLRHIAAHRGAVPEAFRDSIALAAHQRAADYTTARVRLGLLDVIVGALLVLALTLGGLLQAMHDGWTALGLGGDRPRPGLHRRPRRAELPARPALLAVAHLRHRGALRLQQDDPAPVPYRSRQGRTARRRHRPAAAGGGAVADGAKMGEAWWLYVWLVWLGFNLLALAIYPTLIAPLFNKFTPLADAVLKERIEALLARCGFRASGLFVMDGSKRSAHGNAYFTGFGQAKRIVFFDTLLEKLAPGEVEAVLAHELGHYKRRHVWKRIAVLALASLAFLWLLGRLIDAPWFYAGLGMQAQDTAAALVLFSLAVPLFVFPLAPLMSALSRRHEFEADAYAAEQTRPATWSPRWSSSTATTPPR
jgi:STE24 endopeptidase